MRALLAAVGAALAARLGRRRHQGRHVARGPIRVYAPSDFRSLDERRDT